MRHSATLLNQGTIAYLIAGPAALRRVAQKTQCPAALVHTLTAVHLLTTTSLLPPSATVLQATLQSSLPLVRGYVRDLVAREYIYRERYYRRGPRLLRLTTAGREVVQEYYRALRSAAAGLA